MPNDVIPKYLAYGIPAKFLLCTNTHQAGENTTHKKSCHHIFVY